jgi:hypothetical protein
MYWVLETHDRVAENSLTLNARELQLSNGAKIGTFFRAQNDNPKAGLRSAGVGPPVNVHAQAITITGRDSAILSYVTSARLLVSQGGELKVSGNEIMLRDGGSIVSYADSKEALGSVVLPHAGTIRVTADRLTLLGYAGTPEHYQPSGIFSHYPLQNSSNSGEIWVQAREIDLSQRAEIGADGTYTPSHPTGLNIWADTIRLRQGARIWTTGHIGYGLVIRADRELSLASGGSITAETYSTTARGVLNRVRINSPRVTITGAGSGIFPHSPYDYQAIGERSPEGDLQIQTDDLIIEKGGVISSRAISVNADGGIIVIEGREGGLAKTILVRDQGSGIFSDASESDFGASQPLEAGAIQLAAQRITVTDQAAITVASAGSGPAGAIKLNGDVVEISHRATLTAAASQSGPGGSIDIQARRVRITDHAQLSAASHSGQSGNVTIHASEDVLVDDNSSISTEATSVAGGNLKITAGKEIRVENSRLAARAGGDGGNIILLTSPPKESDHSSMIYLLGSDLSAESALGQGGNITIDPLLVLLNRSLLSANATVGNGGNVQIAADTYMQSDSILSASSELGLPGRVRVTAPDLDVAGPVAPLTVTLVQGETHLPEHCARKLPGPISSFVVLGQGGIPVDPAGWQPSYAGLPGTPIVSAGDVLADVIAPERTERTTAANGSEPSAE